MEPIKIHYRFKFENGEKKDYILLLDPEKITYISKDPAPAPEWAKLEFHQCESCPLDATQSPNCPIAANLSGFVEHFKDEISHTEALVMVKANDRFYSKRVSLQEGLYSVYGIIMSTSSCPVMTFLKPMARFHLPFASMDETVYRSISTYLLEQYFYFHKKGKDVDIKLAGLLDRYKEVEKVNVGISERLRL